MELGKIQFLFAQIVIICALHVAHQLLIVYPAKEQIERLGLLIMLACNLKIFIFVVVAMVTMMMVMLTVLLVHINALLVQVLLLVVFLVQELIEIYGPQIILVGIKNIIILQM